MIEGGLRPFVRVERRRFSNQVCNLRSLGVLYGLDWHESLGHPIPLQQTARVRQSNPVDEVQPHLIPLGDDLADRPFNAATYLGTMVGQAAPQQGLYDIGSGATNYGPKCQDKLPALWGQGVEECFHVCLRPHGRLALCISARNVGSGVTPTCRAAIFPSLNISRAGIEEMP